MKLPSLREASRPREFYSGSKKFYCLNFQAVCHSNCKFIAVSCCTVGSTNDHNAFEAWCLKDLCVSLPFPFHWVGDAAYVCTETLMPPYGGINMHIMAPSKFATNFFISQLRVTIERCFGIFIRTWGVFWKPLEFSLAHVFEILHACVRLHNLLRDPCWQNVPVLTNKYNPPQHVDMNAAGQLLDPLWTNPLRDLPLNDVGVQPDDGGSICGSSLRNRIKRHYRTTKFRHNYQTSSPYSSQRGLVI